MQYDLFYSFLETIRVIILSLSVKYLFHNIFSDKLNHDYDPIYIFYFTFLKGLKIIDLILRWSKTHSHSRRLYCSLLHIAFSTDFIGFRERMTLWRMNQYQPNYTQYLCYLGYRFHNIQIEVEIIWPDLQCQGVHAHEKTGKSNEFVVCLVPHGIFF